MSSLLHIARNGTPLGQFRTDQIPGLLVAGTLQPSDLYYDEKKREWLPMEQYQEKTPFARPAVQEAESPSTELDDSPEAVGAGSEPRSSGGRKRRSGRSLKKPRKRNPAESALPGWIACLFAIGAAAGLWAWAQSLRDQLVVSEGKVKQLTEDIQSLQRQNTTLLEMAAPGTVRGVMTTEPQPGRLALMSGVNVGLFRLDDVRKAVLDTSNLPTPINEEELAAVVTELQRRLPPPLAMTLTDSSGRFDLTVPEEGSYALVSTAFKQGPGNPKRLLWLVEIESTGAPTPVVPLSESNAISLDESLLRISPSRR